MLPRARPRGQPLVPPCWEAWRAAKGFAGGGSQPTHARTCGGEGTPKQPVSAALLPAGKIHPDSKMSLIPFCCQLGS